MYNIGIYVYNGAEILDYCGPFEVFNNVKLFTEDHKIQVFTISENKNLINTQGLQILPNYDFDDCPKLNIFLIPGGNGAKLIKNKKLTEFIKLQSTRVEYLLSVCTGSLVLGALDLLDGLEVTTHYQSIEYLRKIAPNTTVNPSKRYVDSGQILTSAGISAGIDMALYICEKLWGFSLAYKIAKYMEYEWKRTDVNVSFEHLESLL